VRWGFGKSYREWKIKYHCFRKGSDLLSMLLRWGRLDSDVDSHYHGKGGGGKGRGRRKERTKFEMRDECRAPKHSHIPLEQEMLWPTGKLVVSG
jgi:hypothetical protein